jgi:predicted glycosyltransferase
MFELPAGIDLLKLPSLVMVDRYRTWRPRDLALPLANVSALRRDLLEKAVQRFSPDLLVADFMPAGPYGELLPALEHLERTGARAIAGFRDVIDDAAFVRELWEETGVYDVLRRHYSAICVYGDPSMTDFADAYGLDDSLTSRVHYCGYLGRPPQRAEHLPALTRPFVLATCGGGADGAALLEAFIDAAGPLRRELGGTWLAVSGPLLPHDEHLRLARLGEARGVDVRRSVPELRGHVAIADCVVAMPGYNTVCDLLSFRRPAVLVPRLGPSREQVLRAQQLEQWGLAQVVLEADALQLSAAIRRALAGPAPVRAPVPLDGTRRALDVFDRTLEMATAA